MKTKTKDRTYLGLSSTENIEIEKSRDSHLFDTHGNSYIDFFSGWCVGNFGWGNKQIQKAIKASKSPEYVPPGFIYRPWSELGELLVSLAPGKLKKCFRATGGTESVDGALQIAMLHTKRSQFISIEEAYHGNSIAALSIGSNDNRKKFGNLLQKCHKIRPPLDSIALKKIESILRKQEVAAFIMEPIICNLAVLIPDYDFMQKLQKLCRKYGTLLIMDEVASGFGRTGKIFASSHFDIEPDILTIGKAMSGGYGAIGGILTTDDIADSLQEDFYFYSTYGWHPFSVDASLAAIKFLKKNQKSIFSNVKNIHDLFLTKLKEMPFKESIIINAIGLAFGIKIDNLDYLGQIKNRAKRNGLLLTTEGGFLGLFPSLTIDARTAAAGLEILKKSV